MAFQGISLQPMWAGIIFLLALFTVPISYVPGLVLLPMILFFVSGVVAFWYRRPWHGWLAYGFAMMLGMFLFAGLALLVHDLWRDDDGDCDRLVKATLRYPKSYKRIAITDRNYADMRGPMDAIVKFSFIGQNNIRKTSTVYCTTSGYDEGVWPVGS